MMLKRLGRRWPMGMIFVPSRAASAIPLLNTPVTQPVLGWTAVLLDAIQRLGPAVVADMTFSIVARDQANGRFGVAVATCHLAVGSTVPHIRSGVGAVATQAHTNPYLGICGLERLEQSADADQVLQTLLCDDAHRDRRQFHLIDLQGRTACWTGPDCESWAGHRHHLNAPWQGITWWEKWCWRRWRTRFSAATRHGNWAGD